LSVAPPVVPSTPVGGLGGLKRGVCDLCSELARPHPDVRPRNDCLFHTLFWVPTDKNLPRDHSKHRLET
jgi:hypothetical protein